jgi:hypothetical protein
MALPEALPASLGRAFQSGFLEQARRFGTSEAELLQAYPTLRAEDLVNAWAYVQRHQSEIEQQIIENEDDKP